MEVERCAYSGITAAPSALLRFVVTPDGRLVFDLRQDLPGKALWLAPERKTVEAATAAGLLGQGAETLLAQIDAQLARHALGTLSLLRRSGGLVAGFEKVRAAIAAQPPPALVVQACDGAEDGKTKLAKLAGHYGIEVVAPFFRAELAQVTGQENQTHLALQPGGLADMFRRQGALLMAYRSPPQMPEHEKTQEKESK